MSATHPNPGRRVPCEARQSGTLAAAAFAGAAYLPNAASEVGSQRSIWWSLCPSSAETRARADTDAERLFTVSLGTQVESDARAAAQVLHLPS